MTKTCRTKLPAMVAAMASIFGLVADTGPVRAFDGEFCGATVIQNVVVTEDQHCTGSGIIVGASGLTIDLGGFSLNGDAGFPDTGIDVGSQANVTIKNGTVRNFFVGIVSEPLLNGAPKLKLVNVTARDNATHGGSINGIGVSIDKSFFLANGFDGLLLRSVGGKLTRSVFAGSQGIGLIVSGTDLAITNVTAAVNNAGIRLVSASGVTIRSSTVVANDDFGVLFESVSGNKIAKSTVIGNGADGVHVFGVNDNTAGTAVDGNLIAGNGERGVYLSDGADRSSVTRNRIVGNALDGVLIDNLSNAAIIAGNVVVGNTGEAGLTVNNPNATLTKNVVNANKKGIVANAGAVDGGHNTARANGTLEQCPPAIACPPEITPKAGPVVPTCGMHLTTSITLGADLPLCTGMPGLIVDADGVTINLNGHVLQGDRSAGNHGIDAGSHARVTIANGMVRGFDFGILAVGDGVKVRNVVVRDSLSAGGVMSGVKSAVTRSAFVLNSGTGLRIDGTRSKVSTTFFVQNGDDGLLAEARDGTYTGLTSTLNADLGVRFSDVGVSSFKHGTVASNATGGITVAGTVGSATLAKNVVVGNQRHGIASFGNATRVVLDTNVAGGNVLNGIHVGATTAPFVITKNVLVGNGGDGVLVDGPVLTTSVARNRAVGNDAEGFEIQVPGVTLTKNIADVNADFGIFAVAGTIDGGGNQAHGNAAQCSVTIACE